MSDGRQLRTFQPVDPRRTERWLACGWGTLSHDGKYIAFTADNLSKLVIYEAESGNQVLFDERSWIFRVGSQHEFAFLRDSSQATSVRNGVVRIHDTRTGKILDEEDLEDNELVSDYSSRLHTASLADRFCYGSSTWNATTAELIHGSVKPGTGARLPEIFTLLMSSRRDFP